MAPHHTGEREAVFKHMAQPSWSCFPPARFCCHYIWLEEQQQHCPSLIQGIRANWGILMPLLPRSCFYIWALFPCHPALKSMALFGSKVIGGGDSHTNAAIHTLSSSASKAWPGNANNKQTIITHNCGWTQPLMTLFNTATTLWRAPPLCSHAPRSISRLALAGVIPTAYSNCVAQGSQPAVKPDAFCKNRLLQGNKWLFFGESQLWYGTTGGHSH